jgi:hypothetical protein
LQSERNNLRIKAHGVYSTDTLLLRDRLQRLLLLRFLLLLLLVLLLLLRFLLLLQVLLLLLLLLLQLLLQAQGIQRVLLAHVAGVKRACCSVGGSAFEWLLRGCSSRAPRNRSLSLSLSLPLQRCNRDANPTQEMMMMMMMMMIYYYQ